MFLLSGISFLTFVSANYLLLFVFQLGPLGGHGLETRFDTLHTAF